MKKSDVLKTFRKVNEATTDGFLPSENTHLVNKQYVDDSFKNFNNDPIIELKQELAKYKEIIKCIDNRADYNNGFTVFDGIVKDNRTCLKNVEGDCYTSYFNINKTLDNLEYFDHCYIIITYEKNGIKKVISGSSPFLTNPNYLYWTQIIENDDLRMMIDLYPNKSINTETFDREDGEGCCLSIIAARTTPIEEYEIYDNMHVNVFIWNNLLLNKENNIPWTPTKDYEPSTKKYVDDIAETLVMKDTNKYKLITCDDPLVINKTDITDIADATVTIDNLTGQYGNLIANENGTWTYTLNGFMNGLETFTFTVGETTQDLVIVPYKEMVYNDNNAGIGYSGTWSVENDTKYSNGSAHYSSTSGSTATFTFTGTDVDVYSRTNKDVGRIIAKIKKVNSDGTTTGIKTKIIDNISESSGEESYYQIPTLFFDNLDYGTYEVTIFVNPIKDSDGNVVRAIYYLDGIRVYNPLNITNLKINDLYCLEEKQNNFLHTDRKNVKYIPTHDYDPATKVYVDDSISEQITSSQATDEEVDTMLQAVLGGDYSNEQ